MKTQHAFGTFALAALAVLAMASARAATMSASLDAPPIDGEDIANYGDVSGTDKWWLGSTGSTASRGQTFTTGAAAVLLKSISYQISESQKAEPTKTYAIRVGKVAGSIFTQVHSETATQNFRWNADEFMTWTFDTPVLLEPYTTYGIDVVMLTSTNDWPTGIPYIKVTADEYSGGMRYTSPLSGTGTEILAYAIASDRIFHLDIERPLGPVFELVATYPVDDATNTLASRNLVLTFSQNVSPGSGNLTIRNLTDGTQNSLAANDPRLTYDQNVVRIAPAGLLDWSKSYAIRIDAGAILGEGGAPIAAISDDTTWNFTTSAGDPLLDAIAALKSHITGAVTLTGPQIAIHKTTIDDQRQRFAENSATINSIFDFIATYDTAKGPLFVTGSTVTDFSRNNTNPADKKSVSPENIHWVVYTVMQHAMDIIYTAPVLARHEALLTGYKLGSHTNFPGPCAPPATPLASHTVAINGSFPITFGRSTQQWTLPARKPTGTYLAPGTIATVTVPPALVNAGYKVRVGAHSWDLSGRPPVRRLERATRLYPIDATSIKVASPYGGGIYIEVPIGADAGVVNVTITGAVRAPYYSAKSFHQTTPAEWDVERNHPAPWADFQSEKFMTQVPRNWIYNHPDPAKMMADWDKAMDAINLLMGFPTDRGKETMYCQVDVIMRSSVHAPGYPAVNVTGNPNSSVSPLGYAGNYLVRGPGVSLTAANIEFHEQGHAYFFPKFGGESESTVNLLQPAMLNRAFGKTFDEAQNGSFGGGNSNITIDNTAVAWMCVFNFSPRNRPMAEAEKAYQHKGHAKYMDIARLFGWEKLDAYWRSFMEDDAAGISYSTGTDAYLLRLSRHVGKDIRPLFHFWGIHPQNPSTLAAAIAAENIPPSTEIRNLLLHYKTLVPADNAAFRTFATAWRGRKPTINGAWEEREHARQWDQEALYGANDHQRADITINEEYIAACANQTRNRVQELVELYYPSGINPVDLTFAIPPSPVDANTIGMVASTATAVGPVEYYFENLTDPQNITSSGWISSPSWQQSGLATGQSYSYRVIARDSTDLESETNWSATLSVSLTAAGDVTAPSPNPMTFATPPYATDESTITMTATTAFDFNSVEYEFECVSDGGSNSGWQASPVFTDGELSPSTDYSYRVRARDSAGNVTNWSAIATANTADTPDITPPQVVTLSPASGTLVTDLASNLVLTFDEPVLAGSGSITLKNLTDDTQVLISVGDPVVSISGNVMTINPSADLLYGKTYAVQVDANAVADAFNNPFGGITNDTTWTFTSADAPFVWTQTAGVAQDWTMGTNWLGGSAPNPVAGDTVDFSTVNITANTVLTLGADRTARLWKFGDTSGSQTWTVNAGHSMILAGTTPSIQVNNATTTLNNVVAGNEGLNKTGGGTLALANTGNSYSGGTTVNSGTLNITGNGSLGAGAVTFAGNSTLSGAGSLTLNRDVEIQNGVTVTWNLNSSTVNGAVTGNGTLNCPTGDASGTTSFPNTANTFTGRINMGSGIFQSTLAVASIGDAEGAGIIRLGASNDRGRGTFTWSNSATSALTINHRQFTLGQNGTISNVNTTAGRIITVNTDLGNGGDFTGVTKNLTLNASSGTPGTNVFAGAIGDVGAPVQVTKAGAGAWQLSGDNTYSGKTVVSQGTLSINSIGSVSGGASAIGNPVSAANGIIELGNAGNTGTLRYSGPAATSDRTIQVNSSNNTNTGGAIIQNDGTGPLTFTSSPFNNPYTLTSAVTRLLTLTGTNGGAIEGTIQDNSETGKIALTKSGNGAWTISGDNSYTGATTVSAGKLFIHGDQSTATGNVSVSANATLGGRGTIGGTTTIAANGRMEFDLSTNAASHDKLELAASKALAFSGASALTITSSGGATPGLYTLVTAPGGITGNAPANFTLPAGWEADPPEKSGNNLVINIKVTGTTLSPYEQWAGAGNDFDADANNDGIANGMAWVLGAANPAANAIGLLPTASNEDPTYFTFTYRRSQQAAANTTITAEYGGTLGSWSTAVHDNDNIIITTTSNGFTSGVDKVEVKIKRSFAGSKLFARLKVGVVTP